MRELTSRERLTRFMRALAAAAREPARVYFTGGATAILLGWRDTTIDIDLELVPDRDELLRAIAVLKDELQINVELASPAHFIPPLPGWESRSLFIAQEGPLTFYHYDLYSQALSKIERGHAQDRRDVAAMLRERRIDPDQLRRLFETIRGELHRYPAIEPRAFRKALDETLAEQQ
jgi:hypothetical protein